MTDYVTIWLGTNEMLGTHVCSTHDSLMATLQNTLIPEIAPKLPMAEDVYKHYHVYPKTVELSKEGVVDLLNDLMP